MDDIDFSDLFGSELLQFDISDYVERPDFNQQLAPPNEQDSNNRTGLSFDATIDVNTSVITNSTTQQDPVLYLDPQSLGHLFCDIPELNKNEQPMDPQWGSNHSSRAKSHTNCDKYGTV